jgi:hypothetical protein
MLLAALLFGTSLYAQGLTFIIHDPSGKAPDAALPSTYQFPDTSTWSNSSLVLRVSNPTSTPVQIGTITFAQSTTAFSLSSLFSKFVLSPQNTNFEEFTVYFKPVSPGAASVVLQADYTIQANNCTTDCQTASQIVTTFQGNATPAVVYPSYSLGNTGTFSPLQINTGIDFLNVSTSATATATLSLVNETGSDITTTIQILSSVIYAPTAFTTNAPAGQITIPANNTASPVQFTITFAPGQVGLTTSSLVIGANSYPLQGTGIIVGSIDALQISYADQTGVRISPQAATPISFGQPTTGSSSTLTFTVVNPATSLDAVTLQALTVTGNGFLAKSVPTMPNSIQPGQSISFQVTFSPAQPGQYTGTLVIGTRIFALVGIGANLPIPAMSLVFDSQTFSSQQQAHVTVQFATAPTISAIGTLSLQFAPTVTGVSDDPAVNFLATSGRNLQVTVTPGALTATYSGQSALTFQTGTTAGTLTFTLTFPNKPPLTKQINILPAPVQISIARAVRQSPSLVVTVGGYDNTYSAGQLSFNFYNTSGGLITPNGIPVDASSSFHQYFFTNNKAGGAFSLQANFPVNGDVTQVGSVTLTMTNSSGQSKTTQANFQ